jgi:hypothetical protein
VSKSTSHSWYVLCRNQHSNVTCSVLPLLSQKIEQEKTWEKCCAKDTEEANVLSCSRACLSKKITQ